MDGISGAPLPSGTWLGSNNMEPGRWEAEGVGVFIPLPPLRRATVGRGPSSCQMVSTQYSVSGFRSPICPSPLGRGEVTALSCFSPRELSEPCGSPALCK